MNSFIERLRDARQNMFRIPESARQADPGWFVGMAIDPAEFSEQLVGLQLSLQGKQSSSGISIART